MPSSPGQMASYSLTNGHASPFAAEANTTRALSADSESESSPAEDAAAQGASSDEDAPGEEYDEDEEMASDTESSDDEDADGEPDGDYDSETPLPEQANGRRSRSSSSSEDSVRPTKRKASVEEDEDIMANPELYGLRRSVRGISAAFMHRLTSHQGRARPTRRIVRSADPIGKLCSNPSTFRWIAAMKMMSLIVFRPARGNGQRRGRVRSSPLLRRTTSTYAVLQLRTDLRLLHISPSTPTLVQMAM